MALKLNSSGGGSVTIDPVSTASNVTITIPATTDGRVVVADSSGNVTATGNVSAVGGAFSGAVSGTTGTFSGDVTLPSANGGQLAGMRNKIINGDMRIAQRGTSTAGVTTTTTFIVDRFRTGGQASAAVFTTSQSTDVPNTRFNYSARLTVTTADAAVATTDVIGIVQPIEGYNVRDLIGQTFTLSFWVKSPKTGIHCVNMVNSADRTYVAEYTVIAANTWEYKTITVVGGLITAGTWDWTSGLGLNLRFALMAGTSFHTTAGAWQTGNLWSTVNQVNCLDTIGNIFGLTGVQLEIGSVATPFEHRPIGMELALCQRYYHRITSPTASSGFHMIQINSATGAQGIYPFPVEMRTNPLALETTTAAGDYRINFAGTNVTCSVLPAFNAATNFRNAYVGYTVASGLTPTGGGGSVIAVNTNAYLGWSAEL